MKRRFALLLMAAACGGAGSGSSDGGFIAFAADFQDYRSWQTFAYTADGGTIHATGPVIEYVNKHAPAGASEFPLGTIIVKYDEAFDGGVFAMVKRGGGYNANGADGWEWFDLNAPDGGTVNIIWRGVGPPAGETYGGDPTACNVCHAAASDNDSVLSPKIRLSGY
jgi:hypothetical protein